MNRQLLAIAVTASLSLSLVACSSGSSDSGSGDTGVTTGGGGDTGGGGTGGGETGGTQTGGGTTAVEPGGQAPVPSGGGAPSGDTKAGIYLGSFGFGDAGRDGVYVIDGDDDLAGLTLNEDGSAVSLFGNVGGGDSYTGTLRQQTHDPSVPPSAGVFGTGRTPIAQTGEYNLNFVPGQTIEGGDQASLRVATEGAIPPATIATVAGSWSSVNQFADCDESNECRLLFDVTFDGTSVSGTTSVEDGDGEPTRPDTPIDGTIAEYGDVLLLSFNWGAGDSIFQYDGVAFFAPNGGPRQLVFIGESTAPSAGLPTIASLLSQP